MSYDKDEQQPEVEEQTPDHRKITTRQAMHLADLSGADAKQLVGRPIFEIERELKWKIDPQLFAFRKVCGRVVRNNPATGQLEGVPNATVQVEDTDCSFLGYFPVEGPWSKLWWFWPTFCDREVIATVRTDRCGNFCVWIPRWDIDRLLSWRRQRQCYPIIRKPNLADILTQVPDLTVGPDSRRSQPARPAVRDQAQRAAPGRRARRPPGDRASGRVQRAPGVRQAGRRAAGAARGAGLRRAAASAAVGRRDRPSGGRPCRDRRQARPAPEPGDRPVHALPGRLRPRVADDRRRSRHHVPRDTGRRLRRRRGGDLLRVVLRRALERGSDRGRHARRRAVRDLDADVRHPGDPVRQQPADRDGRAHAARQHPSRRRIRARDQGQPAALQWL